MSLQMETRPVKTKPNWRQRRQTKQRIGRAAAYIIAISLSIAFVFPFYWMIITALKTDAEIFQVPPTLFPHDPQWQNIPDSTTYIPFWLYMWNTLVISGMTIVGTVISCSLIAYGFARLRWPGRNVIFMIYLSTIMLPLQVTMIPLYIIFRKVGWIGTFYPLIVPAFFGNVLYVFLLRQFLLTIPKELSDAARIDGASELGIFWYIMVPLLKPALATVALFTFVTTFRDFLAPLIYLTDQNQWTISLGLKLFQNQYGAQWQLMMSAATLTMLPILILFFFTQRTFTEGIALTGVKG
jgi:multiple sugar transport system permease protein